MNFIIFDLEWNNAYNYKLKRGMNEIIEIGAVKLDENLDVVDTFKQLIKPQLSKKLGSRFKNLTHITIDEINDNGIPFEKAFDDFAPQAVGCGIQGDAHLCAPVMPESRQKGLLCKRRFAAGYGRKKRRNPSERGSSEFLPLPIPGSGTENCYRCYFFRKKFEKNRLRGGNQPHSASSCSSSSFSS